MTVRQDTLWEKFLKPIITNFIDQKELEELYKKIDWEGGSDRLAQSDMVYPHYYSKQNFHGIEKGYLNTTAAITYDPITQYVLPPNEQWVRQSLINGIQGQPRTILDLGCGTGSTTLMLKQAFPEAQVIGLDLSPYMLVMAEYKAQQASLEIQWRHGKAEATGLKEASFDLITASLLFHETPANICLLILQEAFRLLKGGGQILILDGNQEVLKYQTWLQDVFEEPYIKEYATNNLDEQLITANFVQVKSELCWLIHQITQGRKPIAVQQTANNAKVNFEVQTIVNPA